MDYYINIIGTSKSKLPALIGKYDSQANQPNQGTDGLIIQVSIIQIITNYEQQHQIKNPLNPFLVRRVTSLYILVSVCWLFGCGRSVGLLYNF